MRCLIAALICLAATPSSAQVVSRPTEPSIVTAENGTWNRPGEPVVMEDTGGTLTAPRPPQGDAAFRRADGNDGIWLQFMGAKWVAAGPPVPLRASDFVQVGDHAGFPVYARKGLDEDRIYLPSAGRVVPFRLKE